MLNAVSKCQYIKKTIVICEFCSIMMFLSQFLSARIWKSCLIKYYCYGSGVWVLQWGGSTRVPPEHPVPRPPGMNIFVLRWVVKKPRTPIGTANPGRVSLLRVVLYRWTAAPRGVSCPQCILAWNLPDQVQPSRAAKYASANKTKSREELLG